jgi:hypothetical protein
MREAVGDALIGTIVAILEEERCGFALIGAMAMLAHDAPRATLDIDLLTTETRALRFGWRERLPADVTVDIRAGEHDDPLAGVITFERTGEPSIDLVIGRWKWQAAAIARAVPVRILGASIPVLAAADLVITKLDAGGHRDLLDVEFLLERLGESLADAVRVRIPELPSTLQHDCEELLQRWKKRES